MTGNVAKQFSEAAWRRRAASFPEFILEKRIQTMLSGTIFGRFRVSFSVFLLKSDRDSGDGGHGNFGGENKD